MIARAAVAALAVAAGCASPPAGGEGPEASPSAAGPAVPEPAEIAARERARAASLRVLQCRGVAELRWRDREGQHFEQGDADVRWCAGRGIAVSVTKLGDRFGWFGSEGTRWWRFELKARPTRLVFGALRPADGGGAGAAGGDGEWQELSRGVLSPRVIGLLPLLPAEGARAEVRGGVAWVAIELDGGPPAEAGFDLRTLDPVRVRLSSRGGSVLESEFDGLVSVETPGSSPGDWPRIPRRVRVRASRGGGDVASLVVAFDSAVADAAAADRPALYDLAELRARMAPETVEEVE